VPFVVTAEVTHRRSKPILFHQLLTRAFAEATFAAVLTFVIAAASADSDSIRKHARRASLLTHAPLPGLVLESELFRTIGYMIHMSERYHVLSRRKAVPHSWNRSLGTHALGSAIIRRAVPIHVAAGPIVSKRARVRSFVPLTMQGLSVQLDLAAIVRAAFLQQHRFGTPITVFDILRPNFISKRRIRVRHAVRGASHLAVTNQSTSALREGTRTPSHRSFV
jgi:hypothetical protein